ncbi:MAG: hypothetical protein JOZ69_10595 [Myxococcales bacterium]|nr:hypothetical protein [Myxococcales bacterium]
MESGRRLGWSSCIATTLVAVGCGAGHMAVPADIAASSDVLAVSGRSGWSGSLADESYRLGAYRVEDVDRKWNSTSGWSVARFSQAKTTGGYRYRFVDGESTYVGKCATVTRDSNAELGSGLRIGVTSATLGCSCEGDGGTLATAALEGRGNALSGELATAEGKYVITALFELDGGLRQSQPVGYRVDAQGEPVGAVEVLSPGRAWLSRELPDPERAQASCLFAGLLLYHPDH